MALRLLIIGEDPPALERIVPLLRRLDFEIVREPDPETAVRLLQASRHDLVIVRYPLASGSLGALAAGIRDEGSESRYGSILLLADSAHVSEVGRFLGRGINRIVSPNAPTRRLVHVFAELLSVAPRRSVRATIQLQVRLNHGPRTIVTETHNLSSTGMLIEGARELAVGTRVRFELHPPEPHRPITGEVEVVRHSDAARELVDGIGVRVLTFGGDGGPRLAELLEGATVFEPLERAGPEPSG